MLIDPTQRLCAQDYYFDLNRRTGLHPQDITHCFCTHEHFDHQVGLNYFRNTIWLAAEPVAEKLLNSVYINGKKIQGIKGEFLPGVKAVWLPGHTKTIHGVSFWYQSRHVLVAGDSVMTKQHFRDNTTMFEEDAQMAAATIQNIKKEYDIVIPGHDNMLVNNRTGDI